MEPTTVDKERRFSSLKWKKLPIFMDEVHRNSNQNRINLCPHHHLVIQETTSFSTTSTHAVV
jgi:hypothetical protein